jgi:pantoate--beta-alanine ligase
MGDLHAGHLRLVDAARERADRVVASVFVNPLQFGPGEDYRDYPRRLDHDAARLGEHGADIVFAPTVESLYPHGTETAARVHVPAFEEILCGADRPGHFTGVATVVAKLFNIAEPDIAVFGQKDYQQLLLIRRLVADLDFAIDVIGIPTVREADGVAMSSRNGYLDAEQRRTAPALYAALCGVAARLGRGERDFDRLERDARAELEGAGLQPDYVAIRMAGDLAPPGPDAAPADLRILAAARLGRARLIDNIAGDEGAV